MVIFLFLNFVAGLTACLWTRRCFISREARAADFILCFGTIFLAQIILSEILLGFFQMLSLFNLAAVNIFFLAVSWLFLKNKQSAVVSRKDDGTFRNPVVIFSLSIICGFALVKLMINLVNPPFGWDSLNYHFTFPVEWMKQGNLVNPIVINDNPAPTYYPLNGSLFYFWLLAPFRSAFLADLGQAFFFLLAFFAVYSTALLIGIKKELGLFAAALFVVTPNFFKQIEIAYVDIMVAALFLLALNFLIRIFSECSFKNVLLFSISCGLLIGTKTTALAYSIVLIVPFFCIIFKRRPRDSAFYLPSYAFVFLWALFLLGGYSYVRNFFLTGNPLYPLQISFLGRTIFRGVLEKGVFRATFTPRDYSLAKILLHEGLGVQSIILFFPAAFAWLLFIFRKVKLDFARGYLLILPPILISIFYLFIPFPCTRFLYPFLGVSSIAAFCVLNEIKLRVGIVRGVALVCLLASISELAGHLELVLSMLTTAVAFLLILKSAQGKCLIFNRRIFMVSAFVLFIIWLGIMEADYKRNEYARYVKNSPFWPEAALAWEWLNDNTGGSNIAYVGRPVPFPLYGTNFKNNVYYVSVNDKKPQLHNYQNSHYSWDADFLTLHRSLEQSGNFRGDADYFIWLGNISRRKTDLLFIYSLHQIKGIEFPLEDAWAREHPGRFRLVFKNDTIHIYEVLK